MGAVSSPRLDRHDLNQTEGTYYALIVPTEQDVGADNIVGGRHVIVSDQGCAF